MSLSRTSPTAVNSHTHGWRILFERSQDAMLMFDTEFNVIDANQAGLSLCNLGDNLSDLSTVNSENHERRSIASTLRWVIEHHQANEGRTIYLAKRHANVLADVYPIEQPVPGAVLILKDLTETLNHDQRLQNTDNMLRLGMTAAGISHELSNPLAALYSELELMKALRDTPDPHLNNCLKLVQRMHHILRELSGAFDTSASLLEQATPLQPAIQQVIQLLRFYPGGNQVQIHQHYADHLPDLMICEKHLLLLLENICENALKATGARGSIGIAVTGDMQTGIRIVITNSRPSPTKAARSPANPYVQGMGVGLAISKQIMHSYDGQLLIANTDAGDTQVVFEFPVSCCRTPQPKPSAEQKETKPATKRSHT